MKSLIKIPTLIAFGLAGLLSSCVDPYAGGGSSVTVSQYRPGYVVDRIPGRYDTEYIGGVSYYRYNNTYYRRQGTRYIVVDTPRNSRVWNDRNRNGRPDNIDRRVRDERLDRRDDRLDDRRDRLDDRRDRFDDRRDDMRDRRY